MNYLYLFIEMGFFTSLIINALLFIPQILRLYKTKNSSSVSTMTFLGFNIIQIFVICHAIIAHDTFLLIGTALSLVTCGIVTGLSILYKMKPSK